MRTLEQEKALLKKKIKKILSQDPFFNDTKVIITVTDKQTGIKEDLIVKIPKGSK